MIDEALAFNCRLRDIDIGDNDELVFVMELLLLFKLSTTMNDGRRDFDKRSDDDEDGDDDVMSCCSNTADVRANRSLSLPLLLLLSMTMMLLSISFSSLNFRSSMIDDF